MTIDNKLFSTSSKLIQVDVKNLKIGMYVSKLDRPWLETSFLFQGFKLKNNYDIKEVQDQCDYVYIDVDKQVKTQAPSSTSKILHTQRLVRKA